MRCRITTFLVVVLVLSCVLGCSSGDEEQETIRVGVLPDQQQDQLRLRYEPLLEYLASETGLTFTLKIPASYMQLGQWFADDALDLALFGGVTYVKAHRELGAVPLVLRDVDGRFSSVILVSASNTAETIEDLKNQSFAFGSPLSTSGHIMPRYFMQKENLIPETFFREVKYSGAHDKTAAWVREGKVAAGAANSDIVQNMFLDGRLSVDDVRVLWESPPYPDYVWAVHPSLDESVPIRIRDAFLLLSDGDPSHQKLLKHLGATHYLPAQHADFQPVEEIIFPAGLLGAQGE